MKGKIIWKSFKEKIYDISPVYRRLKRAIKELKELRNQDLKDIKYILIDTEQKNIGYFEQIISISDQRSRDIKNILLEEGQKNRSYLGQVIAISDDIKKGKIEINSFNFSDYKKAVFNFAELDNESNKDLGHEIIIKGQKDIILNMMDSLIKDIKFLIIDVGASDGWFFNVLKYNNRLNNSFIFGYEPLLSNLACQEELRKSNANFGYKQVGIGDENTTLIIKENLGLRGLTSFLDISDNYFYFKDKIDQTSQNHYEVSVITLDSEFENNQIYKDFDNIALKIDVQGFELKVLKGAKKLFELGLIKIILIEITTIKKYESSPSYEEVFDFLHKNGFVIYDILPFYREINFKFQPTHSGRLTEFDAIFVHSSFLEKINFHSKN